MNASESSSETETPDAEKTPPKSEKRSLIVFFSFVAVLVLLVALNMK
jgi:hypothetical protein